MIRMTLPSVAFVLASCITPPPVIGDDGSKLPGGGDEVTELSFVLCGRVDRPTLPVASSLARLQAAYQLHGVDVSVSGENQCPDTTKGTCWTQDGQSSCDASALGRIAFAASMLAAAWVTREVGSKERTISALLPFDPAAALAYADLATTAGLTEDAEAAQQREAAKVLLTAFDGDVAQAGVTMMISDCVLRIDSRPESKGMPECFARLEGGDLDSMILAYEIYETTTSLVFAHVVGHELSHAHAAVPGPSRCPITLPSLAETSGRLQRLASAELELRPGQRTSLATGELAAEMCALRSIASTTDAIRHEKAKESTDSDSRQRLMLALSKKLALALDLALLARGSAFRYEIGALQGGSGAAGYQQVDFGPSPSLSHGGYLSPAARNLLLLHELAPTWGELHPVEICGRYADELAGALDRAIGVDTMAAEQRGVARGRAFEVLGADLPDAVAAVWGLGTGSSMCQMLRFDPSPPLFVATATSIEETTQSALPSTQGGFDKADDVRAFSLPRVNSCAEEVGLAVAKFANDYDAASARVETKKYGTRTVWVVKTSGGDFEVGYEVVEGKTARVWFWGYDTDGSRFSPTSGPGDSLRSKLVDALRCV